MQARCGTPHPGGHSLEGKKQRSRHMETPQAGRVLTALRGEQGPRWGSEDTSGAGSWESSRKGDSNIEVSTGRDSQRRGPRGSAGRAAAPEPGQASSPSQGSRKRRARMGKKGWRLGEGAEHWSSRVDWLEGSEERMRVRDEHQERRGRSQGC